MKKLLATLIIAALNLGVAQSVLVYYDLDELGSQPGEILLSDQYQTVIEFPGATLGQPTTGRSDWTTIATDPSGRIYIRANVANVRTDLLVPVNGQTVIFSLVSDPEAESARRYVVRRPKPTPTVSQRNSNPGGVVVNALQDENLPDNVTFEVTSATLRRGKELAISYALENRSPYPLAADQGRLRIIYGDSTIPRTVSSNMSGRVPAGEAMYGTIVVPDAPEETLVLTWDLVKLGPGTSFTVQRTVGEGLAQLP